MTALSLPYVTFDSLGHSLMAQALRDLLPAAPLNAVDATAGNGYDTLFLAKQLAPHGQVWAFDVQKAALEATKARLSQARLSAPALAHVTYVNEGHECMAERVSAPVHAVLFNLGYLPGSDKRLCTRANTTMQAIEQAKQLLCLGGFLWVHAYTGQSGGQEECEAILSHMQALPYEQWRILHTTSPNKVLRQEHAFFVQKRKMSC